MQDKVHFPAMSEDPVVDELHGTRLDFEVRFYRRAERITIVNYSGLKIDVALGSLQKRWI